MQISKMFLNEQTRAPALQSAYWTGLILLVSACGGGSTASVGSANPGAGACPAGIGGEPTACCDSNGNPLSPPPSGVSGCNTQTIASGPIADTGAKGVSSAGGATTDIGSAQQLVGGEAATGMGGQYAGATAGGQTSGTIASLVPSAASLGSNPTSLNSGSGGNGGSGGAGSASGLDTSALATAAAAPDPSSGSPSVSGATAGAAPYGSGHAGRGTLPNGAHSTGFQFGNGSGLDGAGATDFALGNSNAGNVGSMVGGDPEDYFTRIGLEDSLFKKVERRYHDTSMKWALTESASPSRALSSVPATTAPNGTPK